MLFMQLLTIVNGVKRTDRFSIARSLPKKNILLL